MTIDITHHSGVDSTTMIVDEPRDDDEVIAEGETNGQQRYEVRREVPHGDEEYVVDWYVDSLEKWTYWITRNDADEWVVVRARQEAGISPFKTVYYPECPEEVREAMRERVGIEIAE